MTLEERKLPADIEFKDYEAVEIQDVKIETDNIRFLKEKYHPSSTGKSYLAPPLPGGRRRD